MPRNVLLLHLNEPTDVAPSDSAGNLDDLMPSAGSTRPESVDSWTGKGRAFVAADATALVAADLAGRDTGLFRDVTIQAIMSMDLVAGVQVLIARGLNDGSGAERHCWGIELEQQALWPGFVEARWFWHDSADILRVQPAGVWKHPGDGKFFLFTATRRWVASDKVVLRYYVGADLVAEIESAHGDIAGGTTGHVTLGARQDTGAWEHFFNGTIDELLVTDHEMSPEEIRHTWLRLSEYQPGGLDTFVGLVPPGLPWAKDINNAVGRHVKHAGEALGFAAAGAHELRAMFLPDAAPLGVIERWEKLCGLVARPTDSLDARRTRVVGYLSREEGFSHESIRVAMREVVGLDDHTLLDLLEFANVVTDDFAALNAEKWSSYGTGGGSTIAIVANALKLTLAAGSDVRWATQGLGLHTRMPLDRGGEIDVHAHAKLVAHNLVDEVGAGLFLTNRVTNDALYFGVFKPAAAPAYLGYGLVRNGVLQAISIVVDPAPATPIWLRITPPSTVAGRWTLSRSIVSATAGFVHFDLDIGDLAFDWAGFGMFGIAAASGGAADATFDDFKSFCPYGLRPFYWYAYLDPAHGAEPDVDGAHLLARKIKPAHTYAAFTQSLSCMPDDPLSGLPDHGPCGGW